MTSKRDLKRRVRERQARTGESYMTARRHVLAQAASAAPREPAIPVVEMISVTDEAARLGLKCRAVITSTLVSQVAPVAVLERVRDALLATPDDPGTRVLRAAVLDGEPPQIGTRVLPAWLDETRRFLARAHAGIGGVSENGNMLALPVEARDGSLLMVIAHIGFRPAWRPEPPQPRLVLTTIDSFSTGADQLVLAMLP